MKKLVTILFSCALFACAAISCSDNSDPQSIKDSTEETSVVTTTDEPATTTAKTTTTSAVTTTAVTTTASAEDNVPVDPDRAAFVSEVPQEAAEAVKNYLTCASSGDVKGVMFALSPKDINEKIDAEQGEMLDALSQLYAEEEGEKTMSFEMIEAAKLSDELMESAKRMLKDSEEQYGVPEHTLSDGYALRMDSTVGDETFKEWVSVAMVNGSEWMVLPFPSDEIAAEVRK